MCSACAAASFLNALLPEAEWAPRSAITYANVTGVGALPCAFIQSRHGFMLLPNVTIWLLATSLVLGIIPQPTQPTPNGSHGIRYGNGNATWVGQPNIISWQPMAVLYDNFLTDDECDYIWRLAQPQLEPAIPRAHALGGSTPMQDDRTQSAFFEKDQTSVLTMVTNRIAHVARIPPANMEAWQVVKHEHARKKMPPPECSGALGRQFFTPPRELPKLGGRRIKTALLYLSDDSGGETAFPLPRRNETAETYSCVSGGTHVAVRRGQLVLLDNPLSPDDAKDHLVLNYTCPVSTSAQRVVTIFFRERRCTLNRWFLKQYWNGNVGCTDVCDRCGSWAKLGLCDSSREDTRKHMVGDDGLRGLCEETCGACRPLSNRVVALRKWLRRDDAIS